MILKHISNYVNKNLPPSTLVVALVNKYSKGKSETSLKQLTHLQEKLLETESLFSLNIDYFRLNFLLIPAKNI